MRFIIPFLVLLGAFCQAKAQDKLVLDSLEVALKNADHDTVQLNIMIELARYHIRYDYGKALKYAQEALDLSQKINNQEYEFKANRLVAAVYFFMSDYKRASEAYFKELKINEARKDTMNILVTYINLGAVYDRLTDYDEALSYYFKAQDLFNKAPSLRDNRAKFLPSLYVNIGSIYHIKKDFKAALQYYEKALLVAREFNVKPLQGIALNNLGSLYMIDLKQPEKAFEYLVEGLRVRIEVGDKNEISKSYIQLSNYYRKQKNYEEARRASLKANELGKEIGSIEVQRDAQEGLSLLEHDAGKFKEAFLAQKAFKKLNDSIQNQQASREISKLKLQYDFEKAEQERILERNQIRTRYTITIIVLSSGLLIAVLIAVIVRSRARQAMLKQKNLEQDVEIKNKELTTNVMYLVRKNELINDVAERLLLVKNQVLPESQKTIHDIIIELEREADSDTWKEFELRFNQVHSDFYDKLRKLFPELSPADEKLCAFLRLNMSSKEIAAISKQSVKSVEVARARLRKKLNLTNTTSNLVTYLSNL